MFPEPTVRRAQERCHRGRAFWGGALVMSAYYNEFDRQKAETLRNLIEEGAIAPGVVDERSIAEVQPDDLAGFTQCHFFAGGGLWSLCLRNAGWPDDRPVWTGSCPCGPFSAAGLRKGFDDPRHLWPEWFRLIEVCRPGVLFGEQSAEASLWLDLVSSDLERVGYAFGAADIPAAGFGGAHRRQRFGFVADANDAEWWSERAPWHDGRWPKTGRQQGDRHVAERGAAGLMGYAHDERGHGRQARGRQAGRREPAHAGFLGGLENAESFGREGWSYAGQQLEPRLRGLLHARSSEACDWLPFTDGKWRPVESGTFPLAHEDPARLGRLRLYGDAIDVEAFTNLIGAYLDSAPAWGLAA
jgi:DNA (cytosine-5)-methyltransferase 1